MDDDERIAQLMQKMLRKKLYVVLSKPVAAPEQLKPFLPAHLEYMIGLEKRGAVFASGPLTDADGLPRGDGLTVLRAPGARRRGRSRRPTRSSSTVCARSSSGNGP